MPKTIQIRPAALDDWQIIADHNIDMALESEGQDLDRSRVEPGVRAVLGDPHKGRYYVAEFHGEPAGQLMVTVEWSDWRNAWFWWIQSVYVTPENRRKGVYRALHDRVLLDARNAGNVCGIRLYVEKDNRPAIEAYLALGMTDSGYALMEQEWHSPQNATNA